MDKEKFLESGLLQQYALGLTDEEESAEVEEYLRAYPDIRDKLQQMHDALDSYAEQLNIPPKKENPVSSIPSKSEIKPHRTEINQFSNFRKGSLSFLILLIAGLVSMCVYFYSQNLVLQHELETHEAKIAQLGEKYDHKQSVQLPLVKELRFLEHEQTQKIMIDSLYSSVGRAVVYLNPLEEQAMIHLLDYRSHMEVDELYLLDFTTAKITLVAKLKKHSCELQHIPFFTDYHHLRISDQEPSAITFPESTNLDSR